MHPADLPRPKPLFRPKTGGWAAVNPPLQALQQLGRLVADPALGDHPDQPAPEPAKHVDIRSVVEGQIPAPRCAAHDGRQVERRVDVMGGEDLLARDQRVRVGAVPASQDRDVGDFNHRLAAEPLLRPIEKRLDVGPHDARITDEVVGERRRVPCQEGRVGDQRVERRLERRGEPGREIRLRAREHDPPELVLHGGAGAAATAHDALEPGDLAGVDLEFAVAGPAEREGVEIGLIEGEPGQILEPRRIREAADLEDERARLERGDLPHPGDQTVAVGGHRHGAKNRDLAVARGERARERLAAVEPAALLGGQADAGTEEGERVDRRRTRQGERGTGRQHDQRLPHASHLLTHSNWRRNRQRPRANSVAPIAVIASTGRQSTSGPPPRSRIP